MVQILDVSTNVLCDKQKANNKLLEMINACISHELRSPLNSMLALNLEKKCLLEMIKTIISKNEADAL